MSVERTLHEGGEKRSRRVRWSVFPKKEGWGSGHHPVEKIGLPDERRTFGNTNPPQKKKNTLGPAC